MDYKERYEQALKKARDNYNAADSANINVNSFKNTLIALFPELAEDEDEKIKNQIINFIEEYGNPIHCEWQKDWISWLEKQKSIELNQDDEKIRKWLIAQLQIKIGDNATLNNMIYKAIAWLKKQGKEVADSQQNKDNMKDCISMCLTDADEQRFNDYDTTLKECIDWLENQGEKPNPYSGTSFEYNGHTWGMCARDGGVEILMDSELKAFVSLDKSFIYPIRTKSDLETIKEEEIGSNNKVESKFEVDDWILYSGDHYEGVRHITKIDENGYYIERNGLPHGIIPFDHEIYMRLWDIAKDAKDGDVLATNDWVFIFKQMNSNGKPTCYCHYDIELGFHIDANANSYIATGSEIYPATKVEHDLLFQKMHEAGYEWDADKKQLGRIIDEKQIKKNLQDNSFRKMFEQKSAWNEHDEYTLKGIVDEIEANKSSGPVYDIKTYDRFLNWLKSIKERVQPQLKQEWGKEDEKMQNNLIKLLSNMSRYIFPDLNSPNFSYYSEEINWLKSLKPTWKPSDEQMEMLKELVDDNDQRYFYSTLKSLYNDLEKLKRINYDTERSN